MNDTLVTHTSLACPLDSIRTKFDREENQGARTIRRRAGEHTLNAAETGETGRRHTDKRSEPPDPDGRVLVASE